ncbi:hypothetical protein, partial [Paenibacillus polymyxa]|uniref:hypothetical protein n=1 Tax=Paenibacillus polymyxa TaxID=1406 RepID=UPI0006C66D5C
IIRYFIIWNVYSQKLYAFLGIRHGYLKKVIPELVEQIEEWREERNSEIQRSGDLVFSINIPDYKISNDEGER